VRPSSDTTAAEGCRSPLRLRRAWAPDERGRLIQVPRRRVPELVCPADAPIARVAGCDLGRTSYFTGASRRTVHSSAPSRRSKAVRNPRAASSSCSWRARTPFPRGAEACTARQHRSAPAPTRSRWRRQARARRRPRRPSPARQSPNARGRVRRGRRTAAPHAGHSTRAPPPVPGGGARTAGRFGRASVEGVAHSELHSAPPAVDVSGSIPPLTGPAAAAAGRGPNRDSRRSAPASGRADAP